MRHADCAVDQVNASWACENDRTLNQILKGEIGFQGYVMSDWGAHHSTLAAVAGLDVRTFPQSFPFSLSRGEERVGACCMIDCAMLTFGSARALVLL